MNQFGAKCHTNLLQIRARSFLSRSLVPGASKPERANDTVNYFYLSGYVLKTLRHFFAGWFGMVVANQLTRQGLVASPKHLIGESQVSSRPDPPA
jgi:hypothetical protein